jgi:hypothetical protein
LRFLTWFHKGQAKNGQGSLEKKKKKKAQKPVNVRSLTLIKFSFLARPQKKKSQFLFWVKCE